MIKHCAIIGIGLIGGSLALALKEQGIAEYICAVEKNEENLQMALASGAIDTGSSLPEAVKDADLVVLATPVGSMTSLFEQLKKYLKPGAVVTDVGSTKQSIVEQAEETLCNNLFIGGHPMAGSENTGFGGADPYLFENAFYILTPTPKTDPTALNLIKWLVGAIGGVVMEMSPQEHDLITAAISHLPHFVAVSLVAAVAGLPVGDKAMTLAAGGFRDTTRIAAGNPEMWRDIFLSNSDRLLDVLKYFRAALDDMQTALLNKDTEKIMGMLSGASKIRKELPLRPKGYLPYVYEVVVTVPDRPGIIAMLTGMLAQRGINIYEIEILRAREGYGGTIRIGFATSDERECAVQLMQEEHIKCRRKG